MSSSLPDGFDVRLASNDDAAAVAELARACEEDVLGVGLVAEGDIRDWWRVTEPGESVWLVHGEGRLAAAATLWPREDAPSVWGEEIAAVVRCDVFRYGGGWVGALDVRKPWRRRGVGLALLHHTFRVFHARGERSVGLGVDSENPTGATRLYERAGMHVESESVMFEKNLA